MVKIGILGDDEGYQTAKMILRLYQSKGMSVYIKHITDVTEVTPSKWIAQANKRKADILLITLEQSQLADRAWERMKFHILVYLKSKKDLRGKSKKMSGFLEEKNVIIVNSDNKLLFPFSISPGTTLITCGINSKASVTCSSVISGGNLETIQCCIQRAIHTISGEKLEPQEFTISIKDEKLSVTGVLAAVSTAMADDMEISELNLSIL